MHNNLQNLFSKGFWSLLLLVWLLSGCSSNGARLALTATPNTVAPGQTTTLRWHLTGAADHTLTDMVLTADSLAAESNTTLPTVRAVRQGTLEVRPDTTTTYQLQARLEAPNSSIHDVTAKITVDVRDGDDDSDEDSDGDVAGNAIDTFTATPASGVAPFEVTFAWTLDAALTGINACQLDPGTSDTGTGDTGTGDDVIRLDDCQQTQQVTYTYARAGNYTATLRVNDTRRGVRERTITVMENAAEINLRGSIDDQSRNVVIILTDDKQQQASSLSRLNAAIAYAQQQRGVTASRPAIRGDNVALAGALSQPMSTGQASTTNTDGTPGRLFRFAREYVVAVTAEGTVVATSPLVREDNRFVFDLELPSEQTVALLLAEQDGSQDGSNQWLCKANLEYQTVAEQATQSSEQVLYRFSADDFNADDLAGDLQAGRFQLNELTANPAAKVNPQGTNTMQTDIPSEATLAARVPLAASEFADGVYELCGNPAAVRQAVQVDINAASEVFTNLPAGASPDLEQGETAVYDYALALLVSNGDTASSNRLVGTAPLDPDGNARFDLVRNQFEELDARLLLTDTALFDSSKRRFPLTPSFDVGARAVANAVDSNTINNTINNGTSRQRDALDTIDLGTLEDEIAYISGRVVTESGQAVPNANIIMVLDGERLSFNVATADDTGFYELFIPSEAQNAYVLYGENPEVTLGGLASNDASGVRYRVTDGAAITQDLVLNVPLTDIPDEATTDNQPPQVNIAAETIRAVLNREVTLQADISDVDSRELTLRWQILEQPASSTTLNPTANTATITPIDRAQTSFVPNNIGRYVLRLSVFDGINYAADTVTVEVVAAADTREVRFVAADTTLTEGDTANIELVRTGDIQTNLRVRFRIAPRSVANSADIALNAADPFGGVYDVIFPAGINTLTVNLRAHSDDLEETNELLVLELLADPAYNIADPDHINITLRDAPSNDDSSNDNPDDDEPDDDEPDDAPDDDADNGSDDDDTDDNSDDTPDDNDDMDDEPGDDDDNGSDDDVIDDPDDDDADDDSDDDDDQNGNPGNGSGDDDDSDDDADDDSDDDEGDDDDDSDDDDSDDDDDDDSDDDEGDDDSSDAGSGSSNDALASDFELRVAPGSWNINNANNNSGRVNFQIFLKNSYDIVEESVSLYIDNAVTPNDPTQNGNRLRTYLSKAAAFALIDNPIPGEGYVVRVSFALENGMRFTITDTVNIVGNNGNGNNGNNDNNGNSDGNNGNGNSGNSNGNNGDGNDGNSNGNNGDGNDGNNGNGNNGNSNGNGNNGNGNNGNGNGNSNDDNGNGNNGNADDDDD